MKFTVPGFKLVPVVFLAVLAAACAAAAETPPSQPPPPAPPTPTPEWALPGWELVWQDEFDGETLDPASWTYDLGGGGWGNNEWQFYTDRPENLRLEDGFLVIEARREEHLASEYTSARIKTQGLQAWAYGRIEAGIQLPTGQGIWSAFWMLGENFPTVGWPQSGEIDIMENIGNPLQIYGTIHGPGYSGGNGIGGDYGSPGGPLTEGFHTYAVEWRPGEIAWYLDDVQFNRVTFDQVPGEWVYDHPFFIILNVAVGGEWPGYPDESTEFPQVMRVDYVRVYRDPALDLDALDQGALHVADIRMALTPVDDTWQAGVTVLVVDEAGNPAPGVTVQAAWLGTIAGGDLSAQTGPDGLAGPFVASRAPGADEITFCVSTLTDPVRDYDRDANEVTCVFQAPETP